MMIKSPILFILFLLIKLYNGSPSNSYYLIDIDTNYSSTNNSCSIILIEKNLYRIPNSCHQHLLCNAYHCDDKYFRCVKIRETLCCIYNYIEQYCSEDYQLKDRFRSIYFHISIEHGYCEINLERIEQHDSSYCLANDLETTSTSIRSSFKYIHRYRHYLTTRSWNISSSSSFIRINSIVLVLLILFQINK